MELKSLDKVSNLTSDQFVSQYMKPNIPVIIEDFVDSQSAAFQKWNYDYFKEIAGEKEVDVYGGEIHSKQSCQQTYCKNDFWGIS